MRVLNAAQMREADTRAIQEIGIPSIVLMENAGRQVVAALEAHYSDLLARHGTLEKVFLAGDPDPRGPIKSAIERFSRAFLEADLRDVFPRGRISRGYRHLFPLPSAGGPCKRLHLFLRWMVRRESPDLGLWTSVSPARPT